MELDAQHILDLIGIETIVTALLAGALASVLHLRTRSKPIGLGLIDDRRD